MKKFLIIIILLLLNCSAFSQPFIGYKCSVYGGFNDYASAPVAGAFIAIDIEWFRCQFDVGWSYTEYQEHNKHFCYLNPSIGITCGSDVKIFGLIGITTWGAEDTQSASFRADTIYPKFTLGGEIPLSSFMYASLAWNYIVNPNNAKMLFNNTSLLTLGVGLKF